MKPTFTPLLALLFITTLLLTACNSGSLIDTRPRYVVLFENNPQLSKTDKGIYHKGYQIGDIVKTDLAPNGQYVAVTIAIDTKYQSMITQYTTFYPKKGVLQYDNFFDNGSPLPANEHIAGFGSEAGFWSAKAMYFVNENLSEGAVQLLQLTTKILEAFENK